MDYTDLELERIWGACVTGFDFVCDPLPPHNGLKAIVLVDLPAVQSMLLAVETHSHAASWDKRDQPRQIFIREQTIGGHWRPWRVAGMEGAALATRKLGEARCALAN